MHNPKKNRLMKTAIIIVGVILLAVLFVPVGNIWLARKIQSELEQAHPRIAGKEYRIQTGHISAHLIGRAVRFENLMLVPSEKNDSTRLQVRLLSFKGIRFKKKQERYLVHIGKIAFENPNVNCNLTDISINTFDSSQRQPSGKELRSLTVDDLEINGGQFECSHTLKNETVRYTAEGVRLNLSGIKVGTPATGPEFKYGQIRLSLDRFVYTFREQTVNLVTTNVFADTESGVLSLASLKILPIYPKSDYASLVQDHSDWTQIKTGKITLSGIDYAKAFSKKILHIDSVSVNGADIKSYKNRQIEQPARIKSLFYISLHKFPYPLDIPKISLDNLFITYEELSVTGIRPGIISFNDLDAECRGLSNIPTSGKDFDIVLDARCKLMDKGILSATFLFSSDSTNNRFEVTGNLGPMSLAALNPMVEPLSNIRISTGETKSLEFRIQGNPIRSKVDLKFLYDDLSLTFMKNDTSKERTVLTGFVDKLLIRSDNPDRKGTRTAKGDFERDPYRSQFNYLWKSLLPGIKKTVLTLERHKNQSVK